MNCRTGGLWVLVTLVSGLLSAQPCNSSTAPTGLNATYTPGVGALMQWDAVPSSVGVVLRAISPSGQSISRRLIGAELDQYSIPDNRLVDGIYTWRIQAVCSATPPYDVSPVSAEAVLVKGYPQCPSGPTVTDIDGTVYNTVQIGGDCWMRENLAVTRFRNGDPIPSGLDDAAWAATAAPASAINATEPLYLEHFGRLYNGFAMQDPRGLCPVGWRIPGNSAWTDLVAALGGEHEAGIQLMALGNYADGTGFWIVPPFATNDATNSSGFTAQPGGARNALGAFTGLYQAGAWWNATPDPEGELKFSMLFSYNSSLSSGRLEPNEGTSIRCVEE